MNPPNKIQNAFRTAASLIIALMMGCTALPEPTESRSGELLIVYSGNVLGELKPCGCDQEEDQGGIERRMSYLKQAISQEPNTLLVDVGDNFKGSTRQGRLKARTLMQALAKMKYDAVTLGDKDLLYGNEFLSGIQNIPWVAANLHLEGLTLPASRTRVLDNGLKVLITAVADPDLFYTSSDSNVSLSDPRAALQAQLEQARQSERPDLVVVLTHMTREKGLTFLEMSGVDVSSTATSKKTAMRSTWFRYTGQEKFSFSPARWGRKWENYGSTLIRTEKKRTNRKWSGWGRKRRWIRK